MENCSRKNKALSAGVTFLLGLILGCLCLFWGYQFADPMVIFLGWLLITMGLVLGVLVYTRDSQLKRQQGTRKAFTACILVGMMLLVGLSTTGTTKITNAETTPTFSPPDVFNTTLQMSTNVSGFGEYLTTSALEVNQGDVFTIQISVDNANDLYCWCLSVQWNEPVLNIYSITEGPLLIGYNRIFTYGELKSGYLIALTECRKGDVPGASGNGVIAWISFYANTPGSASISLYDARWIEGTTLARYNYPSVSPLQVIVNPRPPDPGTPSGGVGGGKMPVLC